MGFFLPLDFKLELGPSLSTLGGCAFYTLVGGTGTLGRIFLELKETCGRCAENLWSTSPSSSSMILGCTEGRGLVSNNAGCFHCLLLWRVCSFLKIICHLGKYMGELLNCYHLGVAAVGKWRLG